MWEGVAMVGTGEPEDVLRLRSWLDCLARDVWNTAHDIVVVGVDGLRADVAVQEMHPTSAWTADTVFPTNSFPGWLSALTGADVATHGVPGVLFRRPATGEPVNLLQTENDGSALPFPGAARFGAGTVFTDAADRGEAPFAVLNDLVAWHNSVTARMLRGATLVPGTMHLRGAPGLTPRAARADLRAQVAAVRVRARPRRCFAWVFVELDHWIHRTGYDAVIREWLAELQRLAEDLVSDGCVVVLHSDHGLVPTTHRPDLRAALEEVASRSGGYLGGAGRTCWVTTSPEAHDDVKAELREVLGDVAEVTSRDAVFPRGTAGWAAVGDIVVVASGKDFPTPTTDPFEHGSRTHGEIRVPVLLWES